MGLRHGIRQSLVFINGRRSYAVGTNKFLDIVVNEEIGITTVTMNRPPVNALNLDFLTELSDTFKKLEKIKQSGIVLTSFSDKVFSTGLDLKEIIKPNPTRFKNFWTAVQEIMVTLYGSSCLTVAVINGHAPAGGCLLSLCCDYRIMLNNFTMGLNETQVGLPVPPWLILAMQNVIGKRQAELALTAGQLFSTNEALKIGLVDEIATNKTDAMTKAIGFIKRYERIPPLSRIITKNYLRQPDIETINKIRAEDVEFFTSFIMNPEYQQYLGNYFDQIKSKK